MCRGISARWEVKAGSVGRVGVSLFNAAPPSEAWSVPKQVTRPVKKAVEACRRITRLGVRQAGSIEIKPARMKI